MKPARFLRISASSFTLTYFLLSANLCQAMEDVKPMKTASSLGLRMDEKKFTEIIDFKDNLEKAIITYKEQGQNVLNASEGQDIVVTLGNTGAGKSTLLNLLAGRKLKPDTSGYTTDDADFKIGLKGSETLIPKFLKKESYLMFDLPGFEDTRGSGIAFLNAMCIKDILTKAKSVRFLFIEGKGSFETLRGQSFKKLLGRILDLLPDPSMLKKASLLIVSQSNTFKTEDLINKFILEKIDEALAINLKQVFSLETPPYSIIPFVHPSFFIEEDWEHQKSFLNEEKAVKVLDFTRKNINEEIHKLNGIKVPCINQTALLNNRTEDLVSGLLKIMAAETWQDIIPSLEKLDLEGLKQTKQDLNKNIIETFYKNIDSRPEINFIKSFDLGLYKNQIKDSENDLSKKIEFLNIEIEKKILEKNESKTKAEVIRLEQIIQEQKALENQKAKALQEEPTKKLFSQIMSEIDTFNNKKKELDDYITERKTSTWWGNTTKGIFSLGLHTATHWHGEKEMEGRVNAQKNKIKLMLSQYEKLAKGEKHPMHDEF